jgi:hypothetical protein
MDDIKVKYVKDHYEGYWHERFIFSADTEQEANQEIEQYKFMV